MRLKHYPSARDIREDKEADYFARSILMPSVMFLKHMDILHNNGRTMTLQMFVNSLAKTFQVEPVHVVLRMKDLKLI